MITVQFKTSVEKTPVKVVTVSTDKKINASFLTATETKAIRTAIQQADFSGKAEKVLTVLGGSSPLIVVGVGEKSDALTYQKAGGAVVKALSSYAEAVVDIPNTDFATAFAFGVLLGGYRFDKYLTQKKDKNEPKLKKLTVLTKEPVQAQKAFKEKQIIAENVYLARDLCTEPANVLNPKTFTDEIKKLEKNGLLVEVLDLKTLKALNFGLLLSVAQGSANEPRVVVMKWLGNSKKKTFDVGLVGKGVTFDSGGISLKPGAGMGDMKQDMTGAAVVTATMNALAKRKAKANVVGIVGLVENMPSGTATRPGDIVTSLSGQTVEILNTDAEGRLVLGDCLWYLQQKYDVAKIIDLATLTGATMRALGDEYAGLFANNDSLADDLIQAGQSSDEKLWRLPMNEAYNRKMDSTVADMKNIGGVNAGGSTAACFLGRFIQKDTPWAHLDIAGVDKEEKGTALCPKGATGWGVRLLNTLIK